MAESPFRLALDIADLPEAQRAEAIASAPAAWRKTVGFYVNEYFPTLEEFQRIRDQIRARKRALLRR